MATDGRNAQAQQSRHQAAKRPCIRAERSGTAAWQQQLLQRPQRPNVVNLAIAGAANGCAQHMGAVLPIGLHQAPADDALQPAAPSAKSSWAGKI